MANRRLIMGGLALALALAGCQTPQQAQSSNSAPPGPIALPASVTSQLPVAGREYEDSIPLLGWSVPLPTGSWTALVNNVVVHRPDDAVVYGAVWLARMPGNNAEALLRISVSPLGRPAPLKLMLPACTSGDALASDIRNATTQDMQDCIAVTFIQTGTLRNGTRMLSGQRTNPIATLFADEYARMLATIDAKNKVFPPTFVVGNISVATPQYNLFAQLFSNPDIAGVLQDAAAVPVLSGWVAANLDKDPQKKAFVARTLKLSEQYRLMLDAMLRNPPKYTPPNKLQSAHAIDAHSRTHDAS